MNCKNFKEDQISEDFLKFLFNKKEINLEFQIKQLKKLLFEIFRKFILSNKLRKLY